MMQAVVLMLWDGDQANAIITWPGAYARLVRVAQRQQTFKGRQHANTCTEKKSLRQQVD